MIPELAEFEKTPQQQLLSPSYFSYFLHSYSKLCVFPSPGTFRVSISGTVVARIRAKHGCPGLWFQGNSEGWDFNERNGPQVFLAIPRGIQFATGSLFLACRITGVIGSPNNIVMCVARRSRRRAYLCVRFEGHREQVVWFCARSAVLTTRICGGVFCFPKLRR